MNNPSIPAASPASLWLRLLAGIYDFFPLLALWFVAGILAVLLTAGGLDVRRFADKLIVQGLVLLLSAAYFVLSWSRGGQTIGMRPWRLRVVREDGGGLDAKTATLRFVVAIVSTAALGLGFWSALFDPRRRTWHDRVAGTVMVRMPKI